MPYPPAITLRPCTLGGSTALESGTQLTLSAEITASRSLKWGATGWQFPSLTRTVAGTEGAELSFSLPVTDLAGWRLNDDSGSIIDVSTPGSYTHTYTVKLKTLSVGRQISERTIGPFVLPAEDGSPIDLDLMLPVPTIAGGVVLVPDTWDARVAAAEAAAVDAAASLTTGGSRFVSRRTLLAHGNSITDWWAADANAVRAILLSRVGSIGADLAVIDTGVGGDTTAQMLDRLPAVLAAHSPTWVTIPISVNDRKTGGVTPAQSMANIIRMVGMVRWSGAQPILMTEPPINPPLAAIGEPAFTLTSEHDRRIANGLLRDYAAANRLILADVDAAYAGNDTSAASDGLHPSGMLASGVAGLDAIRATVVDAVLTATPQVFGWPLMLNAAGGNDDFQRADSAVTMGGSWAADHGTWGILSGRAYPVTAATWNRASIDTGSANHTISVVAAGAPGVDYEPCVMTRFTAVDGGYYLAVLTISAGRTGVAKVYRMSGQDPTQIGADVTIPGVLGDTVTVELSSIGSVHSLRVNGMTTHRLTDATYGAGTRVGLARLGNMLGFDSAAWRV